MKQMVMTTLQPGCTTNAHQCVAVSPAMLLQTTVVAPISPQLRSKMKQTWHRTKWMKPEHAVMLLATLCYLWPVLWKCYM